MYVGFLELTPVELEGSPFWFLQWMRFRTTEWTSGHRLRGDKPTKWPNCFNMHTAHIREACTGIRGRVPYRQMTVTEFRFRPDYLETYRTKELPFPAVFYHSPLKLKAGLAHSSPACAKIREAINTKIGQRPKHEHGAGKGGAYSKEIRLDTTLSKKTSHHW